MELPPGYSPENAKSSSEIRNNFPKNVSFEEFYGIADPSTSFPPGFEPKTQPEKKLEPEEIKKEEPKEIKSPSKEKTEEEDWVTVKPKKKKKAAADFPQSSSNPIEKFDSLAEMQLSSNKSNKKKSLKKKLKEIKALVQKQAAGEKLNPQQIQKIQNKEKLEKDLAALS